MKFKVERTSNWGSPKEVEINTLNELIEFYKHNDKTPLIISFDEDGGEIEIYDDYRE